MHSSLKLAELSSSTYIPAKDKRTSQSQRIWCTIIGVRLPDKSLKGLVGMRGNAAFFLLSLINLFDPIATWIRILTEKKDTPLEIDIILLYDRAGASGRPRPTVDTVTQCKAAAA